MRILVAHNYYRQPGGEDQVFRAERRLLQDHGHEVVSYERDNAEIDLPRQIALIVGASWNGFSYRELRGLIRRTHPDVVHFHNVFPLISPAGYYAALAEGVPVVQTLHNFRLMCANALFFRDGAPCESCLGRRLALPAVIHACYRQSRAASGVVALTNGVHQAAGTWNRAVRLYIALSEFARRKFIAAGLPPEKIVVKPNFVHPDPGVGDGDGGFALFVGRLTAEKGIGTLISAWETAGLQYPLKVIGDGELREDVESAARRLGPVECLGAQNRDSVLAAMKRATVLLVPSIWYENFPMVIAEALATGLPVLASDLGSLSEVVRAGRTGLLFEAGNAADLATKLEAILARPERLDAMRREARVEFEAKYSTESSYQSLLQVYRQAVSGHGP